jgi:hypothetical protein
VNDYTVVEVVKGSLINECSRCGAIVLHRPAHDAWHEALAEWFAATVSLSAKIVGIDPVDNADELERQWWQAIR